MIVSGNMLGLASRMFGSSVAGARNTLPGSGAPGGSAFSTFLGNADVLMNGSAATANAGLGSSLVQRLLAGSNGLAHLNDPIPLALPAQQRVNIIAQREQQLATQRAQLQQAAAAGDPAARTQLAQVDQDLANVRTLHYDEQRKGATEYEQSVTSRMTAHYGARSQGFEALLDLSTHVSALDMLRGATTPEAQQRLSAQLEVAAHVGEARLGTLRSEIQYLQQLVDTGQLTPEQQQRLDQLQQQYAGMQDRVAIVKQAREGYQRENLQLLTNKVGEYRALDQRMDHIAEAQVRLTGRTRDGAAVDVDTLTAEQKRALIDGERAAVRTENTAVVERGDFSAIDQHEQWQRDSFNAWLKADSSRRDDERRWEDQRAEERSLEARYEQRRLEERAADPARGSAEALREQTVQQAADSYNSWAASSHQEYLQALDQAHAEQAQITRSA